MIFPFCGSFRRREYYLISFFLVLFHHYFSKLTARGQFSVSLYLSLSLAYMTYVLRCLKIGIRQNGNDMELFLSFFLFIYILRIV